MKGAAGTANARWSKGPITTSQGYIAVRVPVDHPHAWGSPRMKRFKYAYAHVIAMSDHLGRSLRENEIVHHRNGDRADNRLENLELLTKNEHAAKHDVERGRDALGRFRSRA